MREAKDYWRCCGNAMLLIFLVVTLNVCMYI